MGILTIENEFAITITDKCNWMCPYCAVRNSHDKKMKVSREDVLEKIYKIPEKSNVTIYGGEPGLVKKELVEEYICLLNKKQCRLFLETNGTFIKNYPYLLDNFFQIIYHCSQDLHLESISKVGHSNVRYMLIVHDFNFDRLYNFLKYNSEIRFDVVEATYPYEITGPTLSK